jgi:hypothetical protein
MDRGTREAGRLATVADTWDIDECEKTWRIRPCGPSPRWRLRGSSGGARGLGYRVIEDRACVEIAEDASGGCYSRR